MFVVVYFSYRSKKTFNHFSVKMLFFHEQTSNPAK